jgi:metallo-beta-lactamase family protein
MNITVYGAAQDVTGSCFLVETGNARLLVECGLFQGPERLERMNKIPRAILDKKLDAVLLTHAHLDHCGRLPMLVKAGYRGPIYATQPTLEITQLILRDSARIEEEDTTRENKKRAQMKLPPLEPLYETADVDQVCKQLRRIDYKHWIDVAEGFRVNFVEAGHILGSSCIEMVASQNGGRRRLVFSGDIGQWDVPIMRDPAKITDADVVFMETTYGDRDHRSLDDTLEEFHELIIEAYQKKGRVLIPSFAVGRTQMLLYFLAEMFRKGLVPPFPVFLDSPMAIAATELYDKYPDYMDEEAHGLHQSGQLKHDLQTLQTCSTVEESKALNHVEGPCVIIAGAGMLNAGRILHHLKNGLDHDNTYVLIVGYQPRGSLGRMLLEGNPTVKMFGETVRVRATVRGLGGFSAHAGQSDLLRWLEPMARHKPRVVLVHGEPHPMNMIASKIRQNFGIDPELPKLGDVIPI